MRHFGAILTILALTSAPRPCAAQIAGGFGPGPGETVLLPTETVGGNRLTGRSWTSREDQSEELGDLAVKLPAIKSIELGDDGDTIVTPLGRDDQGQGRGRGVQNPERVRDVDPETVPTEVIHSFAGSGGGMRGADVFYPPLI
jgi:hypothetical protein